MFQILVCFPLLVQTSSTAAPALHGYTGLLEKKLLKKNAVSAPSHMRHRVSLAISAGAYVPWKAESSEQFVSVPTRPQICGRLNLQLEALCKRVYLHRAAIGEHSAESPLYMGAWATEKGERPQTPPTPKTTEKTANAPNPKKNQNESGEKAEKDPRSTWVAWPEKGRQGVNSSSLSFLTQTKQLLFAEIGFGVLGFRVPNLGFKVWD